jgi:Rha family phage regulatory protein
MSQVSPTLKVIEGKSYTTSLDVAQHFHKRHDNLLRDISAIYLDAPTDFSLLNFEESTYKNERGKEYPIFNLTRDGFAILAMGFTGKEALQWKIKYINAFNTMEAELTRRNLKEGNQAQQQRLFPDLTPALTDQRQVMTISAAIQLLAYQNLNIPPITSAQIKGLINRGKIEGYTIGTRWVIVRESFDNWLEQRKQRAA